MKRIIFLSLLLVALCGCTSFRPAQKDAFIDDDGNCLIAEYGTSSRPYTYKLVSPVNGVALDCTDNKMVRATLPDGKKLLCYICQNESPKGTMYMTRDEKWKYLTIGLACRLYYQNETKTDYYLVFEGTICPAALKEKGLR